MKLYSQIYYQKNDLPKAIFWGEEALKQAEKLNLYKEEVATGIVYSHALLASNQKTKAENILNSCIEQSCNMHLKHRLETIINLCNEYGLYNLCDIATSALSNSESYINEMTNLYKYYLRDKIKENIDLNKINELLSHKKALSPLLIML